MFECPVCRSVSQDSICLKCGFDPSCDYERYPTFCPETGNALSVFGRQSKYVLSSAPDTLICSGCGGYAFRISKVKGDLICLKCGRTVSLGTILPAEKAVVRTAVPPPETPKPAAPPQKKETPAVPAVSSFSVLLDKKSREAEFVPIACGAEHIIGLKRDGTVVAVGKLERFQDKLSSWRDICAVGAGNEHMVGLRSDGTVASAGITSCGQCNVASWKNLLSIRAGTFHTVGLKSDGTVTAVGSNNDGRCNVGGWYNIRAIGAGFQFTAGLTNDGMVKIAGVIKKPPNGYENAWTDPSSPSYDDRVIGLKNDKSGLTWTNIVAISAADYRVVGLKADGTVLSTSAKDYFSYWKNIVMISASSSHTVGLKEDGTVLAEGSNHFGQCDVLKWKDIVYVCAGNCNTIGVRKDGTVLFTGYKGTGMNKAARWRDIAVSPRKNTAAHTVPASPVPTISGRY